MLWIGGLTVAAGETPAAETAPEATAPASGTQTQAAGAVAEAARPARLPIADAVEGLADLDEPTRKLSLERLNQADETDIPALEKFEQSSDPEVRRHVALLLKRLKRGEMVFLLSFPDGKPIVGAALRMRIFNADEVKVYEHGMPGQVQVMYNPPRQGIAQEEALIEATTDAEGRIAAGRMNDGKYLVLVESPETLPRQIVQQTVSLNEKAEPRSVQFKRGVTVKVTVQDADGNPIPEATVANMEDNRYAANIQNVPASQAKNYLRQMTVATADATGQAVLEQIGLKAVQLVAFADGYEVLLGDKLELADGAEHAVTLKLSKVKPIEFSVGLRNAQTNKVLAEARVLRVSATAVPAIFGGMWYTQVTQENIDEYVKNGAVDLGKTNEKGDLSFTAIPDGYTFFAFLGNDCYFGQVNMNSKNATQQLKLQPIRRR